MASSKSSLLHQAQHGVLTNGHIPALQYWPSLTVLTPHLLKHPPTVCLAAHSSTGSAAPETVWGSSDGQRRIVLGTCHGRVRKRQSYALQHLGQESGVQLMRNFDGRG